MSIDGSRSYVRVDNPQQNSWWSKTPEGEDFESSGPATRNMSSMINVSKLCPSASTAINLITAAALIAIVAVSIVAIADHLPADLTATYATATLGTLGFIHLINHLVKSRSFAPEL